MSPETPGPRSKTTRLPAGTYLQPGPQGPGFFCPRHSKNQMASRILKRSGDVPTRSLWTKIKDVALTDVTAIARTGTIQGSLEGLEEILLEADFGVPTTLRLVAEIEGQARRGL